MCRHDVQRAGEALPCMPERMMCSVENFLKEPVVSFSG